jgi:hypothetical protein
LLSFTNLLEVQRCVLWINLEQRIIFVCQPLHFFGQLLVVLPEVRQG